MMIFTALLLLIGATTMAQSLEETTQILVNWSADEGHIFKLSFNEPTRYDAWRIAFGDGEEELIAVPNQPATHFYKEAGNYVVVVTIYLPNEKPVQIQKAISITPLGSPIDRTIANARRLAMQVGAVLIAIFFVLREIGVLA